MSGHPDGSEDAPQKPTPTVIIVSGLYLIRREAPKALVVVPP